jgi:thiol-disulfide isomerase/thioredoxin
VSALHLLVSALHLLPPIFENALLGRAAPALVIILGGLAGYWAFNRLLLRRARHNRASGGGLLLDEPGVPAILYFTTPECLPCKTIQRPALHRLQERLGERLRVIEVDAQQRPDLASQYGVLSVPTTFIIDASGALRHVNHGVTRAETLLRQLEPVL